MRNHEYPEIVPMIDRHLAANSSFSSAIYLILFLVLDFQAGIFENPFSSGAFLVGFSLFIAGLTRFICARLLLQIKDPKSSRYSDLRKGIYAGSFLSALIWGCFSFYTIHKFGASTQTILVLFASSGITAGTALTLAPARNLLRAQVIVTVAPVVAALLVHTDLMTYALLAFSYLVYLVIQGEKVCRVYFEQFRQRIELEKLNSLAEIGAKGREEFFSLVSHEFRTPLHGILSNVNYLLEDSPSGKHAAQFNIIRKCGEKILALTDDVLDYRSFKEGNFPESPEDFDPVELVESIVSIFDGPATKKNLELRIDLSDNLYSTVRGEKKLIRRTLTHLVSNAVKFTSSGSITITLNGKDGPDGSVVLTFTVKDTGPGISEAEQETLFHPFGTIDENHTRRFGGLGMGLALSRKICDRIGDGLTVLSSPGKGTEFRFNVRVNKAPRMVPKNNHRILVIDDNHDNLLIMKTYLEKRGHSVELSDTGLAGLSLLEKEKFDLIFLDCELPDIDGPEVSRRIRRNSLWDKVPIVAVTMHNSSIDRLRCFEAGMNDFVAKPVSSQRLEEVLTRIKT